MSPSSEPMVNSPPGTSTMGAPSRSPTISSAQPDSWTEVPGRARNPRGRGRPIGAGAGSAGFGDVPTPGSAGLTGNTRPTSSVPPLGVAGDVASTTLGLGGG